MKLAILSLIIPVVFCCHATRPFQQTSYEQSLQSINNLLTDWYGKDNSSDPCMDGTFKVLVADTLKIRNFRYAGSSSEVNNLLRKYGVNNEDIVIASSFMKGANGIDFIKSRVEFFDVPEPNPICRQYYFSPLLKTNIVSRENHPAIQQYILQYILHSYELTEEGLLLLTNDGDKFVIKEHLLASQVWN